MGTVAVKKCAPEKRANKIAIYKREQGVYNLLKSAQEGR